MANFIDLNAVDKQLKGKEFKQEPCHMCLQVRVETDPSDRTQMRLTVASQDPNATYEYVSFPYLPVLWGVTTLSIHLIQGIIEFEDSYLWLWFRLKEFIKEQVIDIPVVPVPAPAPSPAAWGLTGPAAALVGLIWRHNFCAVSFALSLHFGLHYIQAMLSESIFDLIYYFQHPLESANLSQHV